jgi:hypothetical protein
MALSDFACKSATAKEKPSYARGVADRGMDLVTIGSDARFIEAVSQFQKSGD